MSTNTEASTEAGSPNRYLNVLTFTSLFPNAKDPNHGIFILQRMVHFAKLGHRVTVVAPVPFAPLGMPGSKKFAGVPKEEELAGLEVHHPRYPLIPKISMPLHGRLVYSGVKGFVERLHRETQFDLIDAHYVYPDGFAGVKLALHLGIPAVVSARGSDINLFPSFRTVRPQIQWTLQNAAGVIAVSDGLKENIVNLGVSADKVAVIGNGIDTERFRPLDRIESRRRLKLAEEDEIAICVAGLVEPKGHSFLVDAVAALKDCRPRLKLYAIGKGKLTQQLTEKAKSLGVADRVVFVGPVPHQDLQYWFSAADVSCLISKREGCPNAVAESLACGCPVIGSDIPGIRELVHNQQLGILVERNSKIVTEALGEGIARSWDRKVIANSMGGRTWMDVARRVESVFKGALSSRSKVAQR